MISKAIKKIEHVGGYLPYAYDDGMFFVYVPSNKSAGMEATCRESFAYYFKEDTRYVGFRGQRGTNPERIEAFFAKLEKKLKIENKTVIFRTDYNNSTFVLKPSRFWRQSEMHRGFFTLFLRCAACHTRNKNEKLETALGRYSLARRIRRATARFLKGFTKCGRREGIFGGQLVQILGRATPAALKLYLIKP